MGSPGYPEVKSQSLSLKCSVQLILSGSLHPAHRGKARRGVVKHFPFQNTFRRNRNGVLSLVKSHEVKPQSSIPSGRWRHQHDMKENMSCLYIGRTAPAPRVCLLSALKTGPQRPSLCSQGQQGKTSACNSPAPPAISNL